MQMLKPMTLHGKALTMKNKAHNLSTYVFSAGEQVLVDANVWLYMFPAPGNTTHSFAKTYSKGFQNLKQANAVPVLDHLILSEYLNRYCRIEYDANFKHVHPKYKDFRNSSDFVSIAEDAHVFAKKILSFCQTHALQADQIDLIAVLDAFKSAHMDFNDAVIVEVCKKNNLKLMTNDGDFTLGGIELLTTNHKLLAACP